MRKFEFRLQRVREFRHSVEAKLKAEYREVQLRVAEAEALLEHLRATRELAAQDRPQNIEGLKTLQAYLARLDDDAVSQEAIIAILKNDEELARANWLEAKKEAKTTDQLYETAMAEYLTEENRQEQKDLDEWSNTRRAS